MVDDTLQWVIPAISLGYSVSNDKDGRFRFFTDDVEIVYRCDSWIARDLFVVTDPPRVYADLVDALRNEYD